MRRINLDLGKQQDWRMAFMLGAIVIAVASVLIERQQSATAEFESWQRKWERLDRGLSRGTHGSGDLLEEVAKANRVIDRLGIPWEQLFSAIDATSIDDIALLSIEPDSENRSVRILAEAKDRETMLHYVRAVQESSVLKDAHLVSYQVNQQDPQRPLRFTLSALWSGNDAASGTNSFER